MLFFKFSDQDVLMKDEFTQADRSIFLDNKKVVDLYVEAPHENAWHIFNLTPSKILPILPPGHHWTYFNGKRSIIAELSAPSHHYTLVLYGPDAKGKINFIFRVDGITTYSFAHTQTTKATQRHKPKGLDFYVPGYNYAAATYKTGHMIGHMIDHKDNINTGYKENWSTNDRRAYTPEPPFYGWGQGIRRLQVDKVRGQGGAYAQFNSYSCYSLRTNDGTLVPDTVRLLSYNTTSNGWCLANLLHVSFNENMDRPNDQIKYMDHAAYFTSSIEAAPIVASYSPALSKTALRLKAREPLMQENRINSGSIYSRFPQQDSFIAACMAGDREFETSGRKLHAGICADRQGDKVTSKTYIQRSLFFAEKLRELEDRRLLFSIEETNETLFFFKNQNGNMDDDYDHFKQLISKR